MHASAYLVSIKNICCAALVVEGSLQRLKGRKSSSRIRGTKPSFTFATKMSSSFS